MLKCTVHADIYRWPGRVKSEGGSSSGAFQKLEQRLFRQQEELTELFRKRGEVRDRKFSTCISVDSYIHTFDFFLRYQNRSLMLLI